MIRAFFSPVSTIQRAYTAVLVMFLLSISVVIGSGYAVAAEPEAPKFDIWEVRVEGNTLLSKKDIERAIYPYLGPGKTIDDVELARAGLERVYHGIGYGVVVVNIPEQEVSDGIVLLEVTEGKIDAVSISGGRYHSPRYLREQLDLATEGEVIHLAGLQQQLSLLNSASSDRMVSPVLRSGKRPGSVEVEFKVRDELPLHGGIEVNNQYTPDTTETRLNANIGYYNLWQKGHSFSVQYQTAPEKSDEVEVFSGTYTFRVENSKTMVVLYGVHSESNTSIAQGDITVVGNGDIFGTRFILPLPSSGRTSHSILTGFDYKRFKETVEVEGTIKTPITYTGMTLQYNATSRDEKSMTRYGIGANFAPRAFGNKRREFEDKRAFARPNYFYLKGNLDHQRTLFSDWQVSLRLNGQWVDAPLISNEQIGAGGARTVRGYFESQKLGDKGVVGNLELLAPQLSSGWLSAFHSIEPYIFLDAAWVSSLRTLPSTEKSASLVGSGIGVNIAAGKYFNARVEGAWALEEAGREGASNRIDHGDGRLHFSVEYAF